MTAQAAIREEALLPFRSILFERPESHSEPDEQDEPTFFSDLNLDQVLESITAGREEYKLKPFFYKKLGGVDTVNYRHESFRDLEDETLFEAVTSFAQRMREMREYLALAAKLHYKYEKEGWFLDAVGVYCEAVNCLSRDLATADVTSRGFLALRDYLSGYVESPAFASLSTETTKLSEDLSNIRYCLHIKGSRIWVRKYDSEADYSVEVLRIFDKFNQGAVNDYRVGFRESTSMNHVEAAILDLVARLFSEVFSALDDYYARNRDFLDDTIRTFDREVQFYLAYLEYIEQFKAAGLRFCYPEVSGRSKEVFATNTFDLALANKLVPEGTQVVVNDFQLSEPERIFIVSGPNQGGKTTFARTFGQLHHLASIGYPVPGSEARLSLFDELFTHFEQEEDLSNLTGKLEDDLLRVCEVFNEATTDSIIVINEIFASTTLKDALFLGTKLMESIIELDALCVVVTFVDELASLSDSAVSMVSTVVPENPIQRTYKVVRRPADGLAYAIAIAEKYGLTYERLKERIVR